MSTAAEDPAHFTLGSYLRDRIWSMLAWLLAGKCW